MMKRALLGAIGALAIGAIAACSDATDTGVNQLNLDRPIDVAFACYGGLRITNGGSATISQPVEIIAQPVESCDYRSAKRSIDDPAPIPAGQESLTATGGSAIASVQWTAFVLQSEPGTVSINTFDTKPSSSFVGGDVVEQDADPLTPGENGIAVGENPVALATDKSGCWEMFANVGSCDLSALDVTTAMDTTPGATVNRIEVTSSTGVPIRSKPSAMVSDGLGDVPGVTPIGNECPATPTGLLYVAYPNCHAVAEIDASTGVVVGSIQFDANGVATIGDGNLSCPDECDGGAAVTAGTRPVSIDIFDDQRVKTARMVIGADNLAAFTVVELDYATRTPASLFQLPLENKSGTLGLTQVVLSPQIGMSGTSGIVTNTGSPFQYAYGVATDGTVRVAETLNEPKECDTQVDPRFLETQTSVKTLSCLPVGDPATPPRRAGAYSPGIQLTGNAVPLSVAVVLADNFDGDTRVKGPSTLIGYFGAITSTSGSTFLFNIEDSDYADVYSPSAPLDSFIPFAIANQLRDSIPSRDAIATAAQSDGTVLPICDTFGPDPDATTGNLDGPRTVALPVQNNTTGLIGANKLQELPTIRNVNCISSVDAPAASGGVPVSELQFSAPLATRASEFPDIRALTSDETYTVTWEGPLSQDDITTAAEGPPIRTGQLDVNASNAMSLLDETGPFCNAGVQDYDIMQIRGCDPTLGDTECPIGYTCYIHPDSKVSDLGACMLVDEAPRLADTCREFLISLRRYAIERAKTGELVVVPRTHVLTTTPVDGCTSDAQCQTLADYADTEISTADPSTAPPTPDAHTWACRADATRAPIVSDRCVETCATDADCDTGSVCDGGVCVEGVIPPQACVNGPQRYDLRASDAFTVIGVVSGFIHNVIADTAGNCVADPTASPFKTGRIPLNPPACDPNGNPVTGLKSDGVTYDANPCSLITTQNEIDPVFLPNSCTLASPASQIVDRQAPAVRFHNPGITMTIVDPYYTGDKACVLDRQGNPSFGTDTKIPLVFDGYQLQWRQTAGFSPLILDITPAFPVMVRRGPTNSLWVMDDGDFLSTDVTVPSTEGKVFRVEPINLGIINTLD